MIQPEPKHVEPLGEVSISYHVVTFCGTHFKFLKTEEEVHGDTLHTDVRKDWSFSVQKLLEDFCYAGEVSPLMREVRFSQASDLFSFFLPLSVLLVGSSFVNAVFFSFSLSLCSTLLWTTQS